MKVKKSSFPTGSLAENYLPADYTDSFECKVKGNPAIVADDVMVNIWTDFPWWVNLLFRLRNFLVKFVGLKGDEDGNSQKLEHCIRIGGEMGLVSVPAKKENETLLMLTDKHLDAYISVHIETHQEYKLIRAITLVHFKNKLGTVYFFFVKPFHKLIILSVLSRAVRRSIEKSSSIHIE